ncbi:MAG: YbaK/EbsC family protein [bacterium]|nr:YbaK/EbsC family protein [bacterium]
METINLGKLSFIPFVEEPELVAATVKDLIEKNNLADKVWVSKIDPGLADTAAFCEHYEIGMDVAANCVIVEASRAERSWYAVCLVLATTRADINGVVRRKLDARRASFAPMETAVSLTKMEYGGITPIGLPEEWPILIDEAVCKQERVIVGSGIRGSKLLVATSLFTELPNAEILPITKTE